MSKAIWVCEACGSDEIITCCFVYSNSMKSEKEGDYYLYAKSLDLPNEECDFCEDCGDLASVSLKETKEEK